MNPDHASIDDLHQAFCAEHADDREMTWWLYVAYTRTRKHYLELVNTGREVIGGIPAPSRRRRSKTKQGR